MENNNSMNEDGAKYNKAYNDGSIDRHNNKSRSTWRTLTLISGEVFIALSFIAHPLFLLLGVFFLLLWIVIGVSYPIRKNKRVR